MHEMWKIEELALLGFLVLMSIKDMRTKQLTVSWMMGGTIFFLVLKFVGYEGDARSYVMGAAVGGSFFLLSKATEEQIGYGDCWMLSVMGMVLGIWRFCMVLLTTFFLCFFVGMAGIIFRKWDKKKRLPFVPFLLAGYLGVMIW